MDFCTGWSSLWFQITLWMQGLFLFSMIWTVGGTMDGDSRKKFDAYFRNIVNGTDANHPKPKSCKISKVRAITQVYYFLTPYSLCYLCIKKLFVCITKCILHLLYAITHMLTYWILLLVICRATWFLREPPSLTSALRKRLAVAGATGWTPLTSPRWLFQLQPRSVNINTRKNSNRTI